MKILKPLRVLLSLLIITMTFRMFAGVDGMLSGSLVKGILFLQAVPSAIQFIQAATIASAGFLVVALFTVLFGRIYCSSVCPLGTLMDVMIWIKNRIRKYCGIPLKRSPVEQYYWYHRSLTLNVPGIRKTGVINLIRHLVLLVAVSLALLNSLLLIGLLDPFSMAGKIIVNLFRPFFLMGINLAGWVAGVCGLHAANPIGVTFRFTPVFWFALFIFLTLMILTWHRGRWYCTVICPVGTLLGLVSRFSLFKLQISAAGCTRCGKCLQDCKANCIHPDHYLIDADRCVSCFNCVQACNDRAIGFSLPGKQRNGKHSAVDLGRLRQNSKEIEIGEVDETSFAKRSMVVARADFSRRKFIGTMVLGIPGFSGLMGLTVFGRRVGESSANGESDDLPGVPHPPTPPGSISLDHFTDRCTACHLCVSVCPTHVLQPTILEYGWKGVFQPGMDFRSGYCHEDCVRCSEVCPTGAIQRLSKVEKKRISTGKAVLIKNLCIVATERRSCGLCAAKCSEKAIELVPYLGNLLLPVIAKTKCTGCGACEYVCPVCPDRAITVEPLTVHEKVVQD